MIKYSLRFILLLMFIMTSAISTYAAGVYENTNQSAEFMRTINRNASTEIDAAFYNPAGTAFMPDGIYLYFSDQFIYQQQTIDDSSAGLKHYNFPDKYKGNVYTWAFPDIYAIYKKDQMAGFFNCGFVGRGAEAKYSNGLPGTNKALIGYAQGVINNIQSGLGSPFLLSIDANQKIDAYSVFLGFTLGGSYAFNDKISAGLGLRYIYGIQNTKFKCNINSVSGTLSGSLTGIPPFANTDVDIDATGQSVGGIVGFDIKPIKEMNIGFRAEYYSTMKMENQSPNKNDGPSGLISLLGLAQGQKQNTTLPPVTAIGVSYMITPQFKAEASFTYFWNKYADWGRWGDSYPGIAQNPYTTSLAKKKIADSYDNGFDTGLALEYTFTPELVGSIGYSYSVSGITTEVRNTGTTEGNPGLPCHAIGLGSTYKLNENISLTGAFMIIFFQDKSADDYTISGGSNNPQPDQGTEKFKATVYDVALSIAYKF